MALYFRDAPIAICQRCWLKYYLHELIADGDKPGLRVCPDCWDEKDRWKLAPKKTERIDLKYPRPDEVVEVITFDLLTEDGYILQTESLEDINQG